MRLETTTKIVLNRRKLEKCIDGLQTNETIYFTNKDINTIDKEAFKNLKHLRNLYLFDNKLLRIKPNTFVELSNLTFLHLKGNKLIKLEAYAFRGLFNLDGLWLEQNEIEEIDSSAFRSLVKLKFLYLHENRLNDIDRNCFALFKRIGLITLYSNRFENKDVLSYFKPELLPKNWLIDDYKSDLVKAGGFKSDWNEFLEQFQVKLSLDCEKKSSQDTSGLSENKENKITNEQQNQTEELQKTKKIEDEWKTKQNSDLKEEKPKEKVIDTELSNYSGDSPQINTEEQKSMTKEKKEENESIKQQKRKKDEANDETKQHIELKEKVIDSESPMRSGDSINTEKQNSLKEEKSNENVIRVESPIRSSDEQRSVKEEKKKKDSFERYELIQFLGSGAFGTVHLILDLNINQKKAMKMIEIENDREVCDGELTHLWNTNHTNILRYFDHFEHEKDGIDYVCLITEYCEGGDLRKRIKKVKKAGGKFEENFIFDCIRQATNGLKYLHSKLVKIVHRDIKPGNILLTKDGVDDVVVKLADLGVAKSLTYGRGETLVGTKEYMSPEQYNSNKTDYSYSFNTDVWSLGCVLYELLFLKMAFPKGPIESPIPNFRDSGSELLEIVLSKMLIVEPENRIDSSKLYSKLNTLFQVYKEESF